MWGVWGSILRYKWSTPLYDQWNPQNAEIFDISGAVESLASLSGRTHFRKTPPSPLPTHPLQKYAQNIAISLNLLIIRTHIVNTSGFWLINAFRACIHKFTFREFFNKPAKPARSKSFFDMCQGGSKHETIVKYCEQTMINKLNALGIIWIHAPNPSRAAHNLKTSTQHALASRKPANANYNCNYNDYACLLLSLADLRLI